MSTSPTSPSVTVRDYTSLPILWLCDGGRRTVDSPETPRKFLQVSCELPS